MSDSNRYQIEMQELIKAYWNGKLSVRDLYRLANEAEAREFMRQAIEESANRSMTNGGTI